MLCGSAEFIEKTRVEAERLGVNQVHKGGIFAGAALVGLTDKLEARLKTNHQMAYLLATKLSEIPGISVDLKTVQTNLVRASVRDTGLSAVEFAEQLAARGLGVRIVGSDAIRLNSHSAVNGDPFYIFDQKPEDFDIIVLRSKTHFRSFYEPIAREILIVDTPDYGPADLNLQPFHILDTSRVFPFNEGK